MDLDPQIRGPDNLGNVKASPFKNAQTLIPACTKDPKIRAKIPLWAPKYLNTESEPQNNLVRAFGTEI